MTGAVSIPRIKPGMVVRRRGDGAEGVTMADRFEICRPNETPVVYYGSRIIEGTWTNRLKVVGPENPKPIPERCGAGKGAACCIFLTCGSAGFYCERHSSLRDALILETETMSAQRHPTVRFPDCMDHA